MLEARVDFRVAASIVLIIPSGFVVGLLVCVPPREVSVLERKTAFDDEGCVSVKLDVVLVVEPVLERVVNQSTEKRNVGAGTNRHVDIGHGGGAIETGVDANQFRFSTPLGFHDETEAHGMVLGRVAAHDQNDVRIGDIRPAVGHGPPAEGGGQTGHRGAVSESGLVFVGDDAETEAEFSEEVVDLVGIGAAADESNVLQPIHGAAGSVLLFEAGVAGVFDPPSHALDGVLPRDGLPLRRARCSIERPREAPIVDDEFLERDSL